MDIAEIRDQRQLRTFIRYRRRIDAAETLEEARAIYNDIKREKPPLADFLISELHHRVDWLGGNPFEFAFI